jgi:hypothetical protein
MRNRLVVSLVAAAAALVASPVLASTTVPISGAFTVHFPKSGQMRNVYPCPNGFCAIGTLDGFGAARLDIFDSNFQPVDGTSCLSFDKEDDVVLIASGDTLVLVGSGMLCFPGNSGNVPPNSANQDYGHPTQWTSALTVDGGGSTGVFAGATGTATELATIAGGAGQFQLSGSLAPASG